MPRRQSPGGSYSCAGDSACTVWNPRRLPSVEACQAKTPCASLTTAFRPGIRPDGSRVGEEIKECGLQVGLAFDFQPGTLAAFGDRRESLINAGWIELHWAHGGKDDFASQSRGRAGSGTA